MKIRITILTENNLQRPSELTEEKVAKTWQAFFDLITLQAVADDKCHVETVEFVDEEEEPRDELGKQVAKIKQELVKLIYPVVAETFDRLKELIEAEGKE